MPDFHRQLWSAVDAQAVTEPDDIYSSRHPEVQPFAFNEQVVRVFPDMIGRSVPGYWLVSELSGQLAARYARSGSRIYDLGCSLGASSWSTLHQLSCPNVELIAVDNSSAMIRQFRSNLSQLPEAQHLQLRCENLLQSEISNASVVILNYTLQFVDPSDRQELLSRIHQGLNPGGVLILSEKLHSENSLLNEWHLDFKRAKGYSEMEIYQKRKALEDVMRIDSLDTHQSRMREAGFSSATQWFQCLNFVSFLAEK